MRGIGTVVAVVAFRILNTFEVGLESHQSWSGIFESFRA
jgi:hypothetical protein